MADGMQGPVGVIYGDASGTRFDIAVSDPGVRRLDYVVARLDGQPVLGQVEEIVRKSGLSLDEALEGLSDGDDRLSASVDVVGFLDGQGRVQAPRAPFRAGTEVERATDDLVTSVLGLGREGGAYLGRVKGSHIPVRLSLNHLAQKHVSVLAKTGAGKSYTVGVLLEEFLTAGVPLVVLDPHGEYASLRHANVDEAAVTAMASHGIRPRSFQDQVREFSPDTRLNPDATRLFLEGMDLEAREIVDLLGSRITGGQVGLLYQAVKEVKEALPTYTLQDVMDAVARNKSSARWNVLNALEALDATHVFEVRGTPVKELVRPGQCTIVNLKGVPPDVQDVVVTRLTHMLWEARKRGDVPAHILAVEEAHNFCPERGVGNAVSGQVLRTVASEGRKFGLGLVIVSQRPAKVDKNVLSQCNTQFILKLTNPNDVKAVVAGVEGITGTAADELPRLAVGSALVTGGGLTRPVLVDIRPRITRHGGESIRVVPDPGPPPQAARSPDVVTETPAGDAGPENAGGFTIVHETVHDDTKRRAESEGQTATARTEPSTPGTKTESAGKPSDAPRVQPEPPHPTPEPTRTPPSWSKKDAPGIHRVGARVGVVSARIGHDQALRQIEGLALRNGRDPDRRLALYAEIARRACHDENPACIRCPLRGPCEFHADLEAQRQKTRRGVRRLWTS